MYDTHLHITYEGSAWRITNPYRGDNETGPAPKRSHSLRVVAPAAVLVGVPCALLITDPLLRVLVGIIAVVIAIVAIEYTFTARTNRHRTQQQQTADALTATLGPQRLSRADYVDSDLRELADRTVRAAGAITASDAFTSGLLGPHATVINDLRVTVWDCLHTLADLDQRAAKWRQARTQIDQHQRSDYIELSNHVRDDLLEGADDAADQVEALETIRAGTEQIDARLAGPVIDEHLQETLDGAPIALNDSPILRLSAQVDAAHQIIDARGNSPRYLDSRDHD